MSEENATPEDDSAFESGFEEDVPTPLVNEEPPGPAAQEATPPPEYVQITKDQFAALQAQAEELKAAQKHLQDSTFGRIGSLKQALDQMAAQYAAQNQSGSVAQVSDEDLVELREEYPDLAENLVKGLNKVLSKARVAPAQAEFNQAQLDALLQERLAPVVEQATVKVSQTLETKALTLAQSDWKEVVSSDDFKGWLAKQPSELAQKFYDSWDSGFLSNTIADFKKTKVLAPTADPAETRRRRLEAAVQPKGVGGHATGPTDDDQFMAGFRG